MANIKLKDLITEMGISGIVSESPWAKREDDTPSINVNELVSSIKNYGSLGEHIYGKGSLKEIAESLSSIAEGAAQHTLSETEDMFDKVTVSRNMKELTGLSNQFGKIATEAKSLQQRMGALYEDMGNILGRYYEIGETVTEVAGDKEEYQKFFRAALKKFGVSEPDELDDDKKKEFYNYVDANWKGDNESD